MTTDPAPAFAVGSQHRGRSAAACEAQTLLQRQPGQRNTIQAGNIDTAKTHPGGARKACIQQADWRGHAGIRQGISVRQRGHHAHP